MFVIKLEWEVVHRLKERRREIEVSEERKFIEDLSLFP